MFQTSEIFTSVKIPFMQKYIYIPNDTRKIVRLCILIGQLMRDELLKILKAVKGTQTVAKG